MSDEVRPSDIDDLKDDMTLVFQQHSNDESFTVQIAAGTATATATHTQRSL